MIQFLFAFHDYGLLFLRLTLGAILIFHGIPKLSHLKKTAEAFLGMGFRPPIFWVFTAGIIEVAGGLALVAGFLTQIFAILIALQFIIIILKVKVKNGLVGGYEFDLLILAGVLVLFTSGGGAYGLDEFLGLILY